LTSKNVFIFHVHLGLLVMYKMKMSILSKFNL
jgi:hypothetical protein